ncbi:hypothetical protein scyTo_0018734 [Scyliorhinus torazame]|uniref:Uncharacterized protein n=1 Tax=Scyliorhinus torazame TaxID=75743 RepID=A0A401Q1R4_SCYTO|nr:hypothetical protein [Scyliorhinus torazame]
MFAVGFIVEIQSCSYPIPNIHNRGKKEAEEKIGGEDNRKSCDKVIEPFDDSCHLKYKSKAQAAALLRKKHCQAATEIMVDPEDMVASESVQQHSDQNRESNEIINTDAKLAQAPNDKYDRLASFPQTGNRKKDFIERMMDQEDMDAFERVKQYTIFMSEVDKRKRKPVRVFEEKTESGFKQWLAPGSQV